MHLLFLTFLSACLETGECDQDTVADSTNVVSSDDTADTGICRTQITLKAGHFFVTSTLEEGWSEYSLGKKLTDNVVITGTEDDVVLVNVVTGTVPVYTVDHGFKHMEDCYYDPYYCTGAGVYTTAEVFHLTCIPQPE